jgi:hypothetical protein
MEPRCKDCNHLDLNKPHEPMKSWVGEPSIIYNWCRKGRLWRDPDEPVCQTPSLNTENNQDLSTEEIKELIGKILEDISTYQQEVKHDTNHYQSLHNCQAVLLNLRDYIEGKKTYTPYTPGEGLWKVKEQSA